MRMPMIDARFDPDFYTAGSTRFYLPLLYDIVISEKPRFVVTLGLGDAQAHLAFCQAAVGQNRPIRYLGVRRRRENELATDDPAWVAAQKRSTGLYRGISELLEGDVYDVAKQIPDVSIEVLLVDDVDEGSLIREELTVLRPKLTPDALVLVHGIDLERDDSPRSAWKAWAQTEATAEFHDGIGLAITTSRSTALASELRVSLFDKSKFERTRIAYQLLAEAMIARCEADRACHEGEVLGVRQIWFDTVLEDRAKAQEVMDGQARIILGLEDKLKKAKEKATAPKDSKSSVPEKKRRRSLPERIVREIARVPRNLRRLVRPSLPMPDQSGAIITVEQRYARWIADHEPSAHGLEKQRTDSAKWSTRPKISLLVPIFDPLPKFLDELLGSIQQQTYGNWEACLVDGGSESATSAALLKRWEKNDSRVRLERLPKNLGVAENTNRALRMATGDFTALVDHDDLLPPFALFELASAIRQHPAADIFYSDEDRLRNGRRVSPFFKPEWSPDLLYSFMYLGHLTVYRRQFAVELRGFRKEFDLSQDYDFALRATECARQIVHIPHVLYHWREHAASGASGGKPEARKTNISALADAVKRRGLDAEVIEYPTANRVRMRMRNSPRVSVIIPTDSPVRAEKCARDLPAVTGYPEVEFIIVTRTALSERLHTTGVPINDRARFVAFDKPFNFSAKCNVGAQVATGRRLIFLNDDVEANQRDWIENVIEPLENREVGAVSPKLIYPTGRIQHAGLVTGVRGLVDTALHEWPADSVNYINYAQSMRTVSALSAACLAIRRDDFIRLRGFDEMDTPIAHSDLDLCFKIREAGLRCVYTPFASMTHHGHASIGAQPKATLPDKSSVFLLRRWAAFTCRDPYYTENMRDWLGPDSPRPVRMFGARNLPVKSSARDFVLVSHELSLSGAPLMVCHLAKWCKARDIFVVVMSPSDGPLRDKFTEAEIPVIIDPLLATGYETITRFSRGAPVKSHSSFIKLAREFDCLVVSTICGAPLIQDARQAGIPNIWWIHEGTVGDQFLKRNSSLGAIPRLADLIITPDKRSSRIYQPFADRPVRVLPYGIPDVASKVAEWNKRRAEPLRFLLLGTIEERKGQQTFLEALRRLPADVLNGCEFLIVGRPHDANLAGEIRRAEKTFPSVVYQESVSHADALGLIGGVDVMVCASWEETGPLTLIEGLALGKAVLSTRVGIVGETLISGKEALFVEAGDSAGFASAIDRLVREPDLVKSLQASSRAAYEKYFTLDRFGTEFVALLEETISSTKRDGGTKIYRRNETERRRVIVR
jgi:GT2 family glycosyltransferase/glycosyltransferase involved in cell wall biosynthesis